MAVVDSKKRTTRPEFCIFKLRLDYVEDYRNTILVVVSYNPLMGVSSVRHNNSVSFAGKLGRVIGLHESYSGIVFQAELVIRLVILLRNAL